MSAEHQQMVADARLVIRYGMNSGRLADAGTLETAVDKRDPLDPRNQRKLIVMQGLFAALCIVLTTLIAGASLILRQKTTALDYVVETEAANPREQYVKVWQLCLSTNATAGTTTAIGPVFEQQVNQLRIVDRKLRGAVAIVEPAIARGSWLFCHFGVSGLSCASTTTTSGVIGVAAADQPPPSSSMSFEAWQAKCKQQPDNTREQQLTPLIAEIGKGHNNDQLRELTVFPQYGLYFTSVSAPDFSLHQLTLRAEIPILSVWLLPFLYGLLGASVFCTRSSWI